MSTWTNEFDVFRDLDRLSGFKKSNVTYPALNAFGRGKLIVKEDRNGRKTKIAQFSPPPKIPEAQSSSEVEVLSKMDDETTWERDRDLYFQLRQVCGRGYSNEYIEEEFGQSEWHNEKQLNDLPCDLPVEDFLAEESNKLIISDSEHTTLKLNESASPQLQSSNMELVLRDVKDSRARLFVHPPKLKPSRNALLNGLARRKILQLSDEPNMIGPPITCNGERTVCNTENVIYNDKLSSDSKLLGSEFVTEPSHLATEDRLATSNLDSQRTEESMGICGQAQTYGEAQKQCINWSDIRKFKASRHSPASVYSDGTPRSSPVHKANSHTPQMSRQDSKVKSIPVTNIIDFPGLSASSNSLGGESVTSEEKHNDRKMQGVSHQSLGVQYKSKDERTKEYWCSLPSSPTQSVTSGEKLSWCSLRKHSSHPKNVTLSDYIDSYSSELVPTQIFSEIPHPLQEELRNCDELQINSVKDFPPLQ